MPDEHQMERRVRLLKEAFRADLDRLLTYLRTDEGRMAFQIALTPEEQLQRWQDPNMKMQIMEGMIKKDGPDTTARWIKRMNNMEAQND